MNALTVPTGRGFFTYVHRDSSGTVLYVGSTTNPLQRLANHVQNRKKSHWFGDVAAIEWTVCSDRDSMLSTETRLIQELRPPHNTAQHPEVERARVLGHFARRKRVDPVALRTLSAVGSAIDEWAAA